MSISGGGGTLISNSHKMYRNSVLFNSSDVNYDNTESGLNSDSVQDAVDELYDRAIDYTSIDTRVSDLETAIGNSTLTTTTNTLTGAINELDSDISAINSAIAPNTLSFGWWYFPGGDNPTVAYVPHPNGRKPKSVTGSAKSPGHYMITITVDEIENYFTRLILSRADTGGSIVINLTYYY